MLPNLRTLIIMGAVVRADTPPQPLESFLSIRTLVLLDLAIDRGPDPVSSTFTYWDIARPFPNLRHLRMVDLLAFWLMSEDTPPTSFPELPLDYLFLRVGDSGTLLQQCLDMGCLRSIKALDVESGWFDTTSTLNRVVERYGHRIEHISVVLSTG